MSLLCLAQKQEMGPSRAGAAHRIVQISLS